VRSNKNIEHLFSAGGVVYRKVNDMLEIILCGMETPVIWALPKGTPEKNETIEQTALREVQEETGLQVKIQTSLGDIQYSFVGYKDKIRYHKTVRFYLMVPTGGNTSLHDPEFDFVRWFTESQVFSFMTHSSEMEIVRKGLDLAISEQTL
jgi:8-oxo-dGTP pyrophosphatase MutT (NUDIX family)